MIVVADTGPLISLAVINKLVILDTLFGDVYIPNAVWEELINYIDAFDIPKIKGYRKNVINIKQANRLISLMDKGESEAVLLFEEIKADYLLIDDKRAREIAELRSITCIGTMAVLIKAKKEHLISELRPLFIELIAKKRYYSIALLNTILSANNENII